MQVKCALKYLVSLGRAFGGTSASQLDSFRSYELVISLIWILPRVASMHAYQIMRALDTDWRCF